VENRIFQLGIRTITPDGSIIKGQVNSLGYYQASVCYNLHPYWKLILTTAHRERNNEGTGEQIFGIGLIGEYDL